MHPLYAAAFQALTIRDIVSDIPHDAGAVITFAIVGLFIAFVWHGSRSGGNGPGSEA